MSVVGESNGTLPPLNARSQHHPSLIPSAMGDGLLAAAITGGAGAKITANNKLTSVEAQRIMAVLTEAQRKIQMVTSLPDNVDKRYTNTFGQEIGNAIAEYQELQEKYRKIVEEKQAQTEDWKSIPEVIELEKQLRNATKSLCRTIQQSPNAVNKLKFLQIKKPAAVAHFEVLLDEIKNLVFERLRTTVEEEKAKQEQLAHILAKEQKTSAEVAELQNELEGARKERTIEINKRNEIIRKLKDELREIKRQAEDSTNKMESKSKQKEDADLKQFKAKEAALTAEINQLRTQLDETRKKDRELELSLRKKKFKIETEVENWIHKYDQDMEEKQSEIEEISAIFAEEKSQLDELVRRYAELEKEYAAIVEEKKRAEEEKRAKEEQHRKWTNAATMIQALFRGYRVRREIKNKNKKKPGKETKEKKKAK